MLHYTFDSYAPAVIMRLWVSDFPSVSASAGIVFVAFVIDVYACYIVGWRISQPAISFKTVQDFPQLTDVQLLPETTGLMRLTLSRLRLRNPILSQLPLSFPQQSVC